MPDHVGPEAIAALRRLAAPTPTVSASVAVIVLMAGGHRVDLTLARGHPLLGTLRATVVEHGLGRAHGGVVRLRLGDGAEPAMAARDIVGVITDPPVRVNGSDLEAGTPGQRVIAADFQRYGDVLGPDDHGRLLTYVNRQARNFRPDGEDSSGFRRSLVLDHFPTFARLIEARVRDHRDDLEDYFGVDTPTSARSTRCCRLMEMVTS